MRKRKLPTGMNFSAPKGLSFELSPRALELWAPDLQAAAAASGDSAANTVSVLEPIGYDPWTGTGVTVKRIDGALRSIGAEEDITVNINSPGGDLFEGMAIYNRLREHKGNVQVKVLGLAASAASIIAMAGDEVLVPRAGFLMIHNTWVITLGNRNDLRDIADQLEPFDAAMADIYAARTGMKLSEVAKMMDSETWINGSAAIDQGFADGYLPADEVTKDEKAMGHEQIAAHMIDVAMAKAGVPRSSRREWIKAVRGMSGATPPVEPSSATPSAGEEERGTQNATDEGAEILSALRAFQITL
jgi:ATP-dependent protease ClpP protease subunit